MTYRFQAEIKAELLRAMAHLAAQRDVRYYMQGVQVYATPEVILGATDGSVVGVLRTHQLASCCFEIRVPNDILKQMAKARGIAVLGSDDGAAWVLKVGALSLAWKAEQERYPELHRALPARVSGEACKFDARLLGLFLKVANDLGQVKDKAHAVLLGQNGQNPALVSMPDVPDFIGALAPLRNEAPHPAPAMIAPQWAKEPPAIPANWRAAAETCDLV